MNMECYNNKESAKNGTPEFYFKFGLVVVFVKRFNVNNSRRFPSWLQYKRRLKTALWDPEPFRTNNFEKWGRLPSLANITYFQ